MITVVCSSRWRLFPMLFLLAGSPAVAEDARIDYLLYCGGCHLTDGRGSPPEVPDLRQNLVQFTASEAGRAYLVQVPGSFQAPISDERLGNVLNWIVSSYNDAPDFKPFTGAEVGRLRKSLLMDPLSVRSQLTEAASEQAARRP